MKEIASAATLILLLGGCHLYGDDDDCLWEEGDVTSVELRNPQSGACELYQSIEGGGCIDGDYGGVADREAAPDRPDWALCLGRCSGLDELACMLATQQVETQRERDLRLEAEEELAKVERELQAALDDKADLLRRLDQTYLDLAELQRARSTPTVARLK